MASGVKTIVATGLSSGLGFEALKQLLLRTTPFKIIIGVRDTRNTNDAISKLDFDRAAHAVTVLPVDLSSLTNVKSFAKQALDTVGQGSIDYLLMNAGLSRSAVGPGPHGSRWCEAAVVNHFSQHYLVHLLREKLVASKGRIVVVSSGAVRNVDDPGTLEETLKADSGADVRPVYAGSKFIQLLGAHWWRRQLRGQCDVVAVSPGLIPNTGLGRHGGMTIPANLPDAKTIPEGAASILEALARNDFPEDPDRIFLTSWGEWWDVGVIEKTTDKALQDKWSPGVDELERDAGIATE